VSTAIRLDKGDLRAGQEVPERYQRRTKIAGEQASESREELDRRIFLTRSGIAAGALARSVISRSLLSVKRMPVRHLARVRR
jgi:hypothetical protein